VVQFVSPSSNLTSLSAQVSFKDLTVLRCLSLWYYCHLVPNISQLPSDFPAFFFFCSRGGVSDFLTYLRVMISQTSINKDVSISTFSIYYNQWRTCTHNALCVFHVLASLSLFLKHGVCPVRRDRRHVLLSD
jgi:hypothetical protein